MGTYAKLLWLHLGLIILSMVSLCILLSVGVSLSNRQGFPTLSRMLNDSQVYSICFATVFFIWGDMRIISTIVYTLQEDSANCSLDLLAWGAAFFGAMQVLFMILVTLVPLDYNQTAHFWVAGTAVGSAFMRELLMAFWRQVKYSHDAWIMVSNYLALTVMMGIAIAFVVTINIKGPEMLEIAALEYMLLTIVVVLPAWQLFDIQKEMAAEMNKARKEC